MVKVETLKDCSRTWRCLSDGLNKVETRSEGLVFWLGEALCNSVGAFSSLKYFSPEIKILVFVFLKMISNYEDLLEEHSNHKQDVMPQLQLK
jgi:hypothetical protein